MQEMKSLQETVKSLTMEVKSLQETVKSLTMEMKSLKDEFKRLEEKESSQVNTQVMFHAQLSTNREFLEDTTIIFDHAVTNLGDRYAPSLGVFVCPVDGYYVFTYSFNSVSYRSAGKLLVNGQMVQDGPMTSFDSSSTPSGVSTTTAYVCCHTNDAVYVQPVKIHTDHVAANLVGKQSTFSGFLQYETEC